MNTTIFIISFCVLYQVGLNYAEKKITYKLDIKTSSRRYAGTIDTVSFQLIGLKNNTLVSTAWVGVSGSNKGWFNTGEIDHLNFQRPDIEDLHSVAVRISREGRIFTDTWWVDWIRVTYKGREYKAYFFCKLYQNLKAIESYQLSLEECPKGFIHTTDKYGQFCKDRNECDSTCKDDHSVCYNYDGGYTCKCDEGFERIGDKCEDINECYYPSATKCFQINHSSCINTVGGYTCQCNEGYQEKIVNGSQTCQDMNECQSHELNLCDHTCTNTEGSFACSCKFGFKLGPDGYTCIEASECAFNPCNDTTSTCYDIDNDYFCVCKDGFMHENNVQKLCIPRPCHPLFLSDKKVIVQPERCYERGATHFGDQCEFTCKRGYRLHEKSAREFVCNKDGIWKPRDMDKVGKARLGREPARIFTPSCVPTLCHPLDEIENGYIVPNTCSTSGIQHGGECNYYCDNGFKLVGSKSVTCMTGKFNQTFNTPHCVKIPHIQCPDDITISLPLDSNVTKLHEKYRGVITNMPESNIRSEPPLMGPETAFPLGVNMVHMYAFNYIGDEAKCTIRVIVRDTTGPVIEYCPGDMYYNLENSNQVYVSWKEPVFVDNTGIKMIHKSQENNKLYAPMTFNVVYDAVDSYNNAATCAFTVHIKVPTCSFESIGGGDGAIGKFCVAMAGKRAFCNAQCPPGKTFHEVSKEGLRNAWWCTSGKWEGITRVPDCVDFVEKHVEEPCPEGLIETLDYRNAKAKTVCGKCPKGTHYAFLQEKGKPTCEPCPLNTYQGEEGQFYCKQCKRGFGTWYNRQSSRFACEGLCPPGFRSRSGFVDLRAGGCIPCAKNSYSTGYGRKACHPCPSGYITEEVGSNSLQNCKAIPKELIAFPSPEIEVFAGSTFHFDCISYSLPAPLYSWRLLINGNNNSVFRHSTYDLKNRHKTYDLKKGDGFALSRYSITGAKPTDTGTYTCSAKYTSGELHLVDVHVKVKV